MIYVGIDNGISGAIAILKEDGSLDTWMPMPIQKTHRGNEVVPKCIHTILWRLKSISPITVIIEEPGGSQSAKSASSMAGSFHAIRAVLDILQIRYHRITPQSWQKKMLKCKPGDTKKAALVIARSLWPEASWLETPRCRTPHDGAIDAALIAEYGRRNNL